MKRFTVIVALALCGLLASAAHAEERSHSIRLGGYYVDPTGEFFEEVTGDVDDTTLFFEGDESDALFVSYEYRFADKLGLEVSLSRYDLDVDGYFALSSRAAGNLFRVEFRAETELTPLSVGLNRHFGSSEVWDFYGGFFASYVIVDSLEFQSSEVTFLAPGAPPLESPFQAGDTIEVKDELGWGALLGLDVRLGASRKWFLTSAVRYARTAIEVDGEGADNSEIDVDPWLFQFGFGVSF